MRLTKFLTVCDAKCQNGLSKRSFLGLALVAFLGLTFAKCGDGNQYDAYITQGYGVSSGCEYQITLINNPGQNNGSYYGSNQRFCTIVQNQNARNWLIQNMGMQSNMPVRVGGRIDYAMNVFYLDSIHYIGY